MDTTKMNRRENPKATAGFLNLLFFGWTASIFWKGSRRDLKITDLYAPLKSDESESLGDRLEKEWKKELMKADQEAVLRKNEEKSSKTRPNLIWPIVRMFWAPYMVQGILLLVQTSVLRIMQAILQEWVIGYFNSGNNLTTRNQVLLYASLLALVNLGVVFIVHHNSLRNQQIGMCIRVACCSMIYRKVLRLDQTAINSKAAGQVTNLISNDVARFDLALTVLHNIWVLPIQVLLIGYVMWRSVGMVGLLGIGVMIVQTIPILGYASKLSAKFRRRIAVKTDQRVQLMSELISGIQVLKMYSWEKPFELIVSRVREWEMNLIGHMANLKGFCMTLMSFSEKVTLYLTLIIFVLMGNSLTAEITYLISTLLIALKITCAINFPQAMIMGGETAVSLNRLTKFLLLDEIKFEDRISPTANNGHKTMENTMKCQKLENGVKIKISKVAANWVHGQLPPTLHNVSMTASSQCLCAIVGPVGSGKSSLLNLLLGELPARAGKVSFFTGENSDTRITSRDFVISYASQDPWLFSASIRDNILFGLPYDEKRYKEVTRVCALFKDFEQLPQGDLSFVGERGKFLSGGQKARVNLARAVYRDADLYLLDDPLSAVDPRVGQHLFEECITGFLKNKTRILVTHQLQYLRQADNVVVLNRGTVEREGTYEDLCRAKFHILDSQQSEELREFENIKDGLEKNMKCETIPVTTHSNNEQSQDTDNTKESQGASDEVIATGALSNEVYRDYFLAGSNRCSLVFLLMTLLAAQVAFNGIDYWIMYWTNQESVRFVLQLNESINDHTIGYGNHTDSYHQQVASQWFDEYGLLRSKPAIYVYTACIVSGIFLTALRSILFMKTCIKSSRNIHGSMLANISQATMRFFDVNPSGRILNRFSQDVGVMDELLPRTMLETIHLLMLTIGVFVMVVLVNVWTVLPGIAMGGIIYGVRRIYLTTAQDVQRLEGVAKSPLFSHVYSTLDGLTTIRSRGSVAEGLLRREFDRYQDTHTGAWYLTIAIMRAFGLFVDLTSCSFIACLCFFFILMDDGETLPGSVGLAISQSLMLIGLVQQGIKQSAQISIRMTSIERVLQYTNLPKEGPLTTENPPPLTWPVKGGLVFKKVTMRYADNKPPVLKSLNLNINPSWKVGIVGRTGAGKSSLIAALFRLTGDGLEGEILLDGIDTKSIGLHELRPRISIIPQEPILFSASLRYNLDPFEQYSDSQLWDALREVELGDAVTALDCDVAKGGTNFSVGQRQLICLARAILRNNPVLVLDEATANVDQRTDALIQETIRRRFANCTVLTIAHRLNTIMDSDRVLVMAGGRIVEFGHPHLLLEDRDTHFSEMVRQTGNATAETLAEIAASAFLRHTVTVPNDETTYL